MAAGIVLIILILFFILLITALVYFSRIKTVGPNEVMVVSGRKHKDSSGQEMSYYLVKGGRAFIWPFIERVDYLSLELLTIETSVDSVYTKQGVRVSLEGVAQIKVASDDVSIRTAAERFLSKGRAEIMNIAHETLAGHLRAICGTLSLEEIYRERDKFAQSVQEVSASDLMNMGLGIDSFVIKDIRDSEGYLEALGRPRIAEVKRDAVIAEQLARTREQEAVRDYGIKQASYEAEVQKAKAEADLAYKIQQAITSQKLKEQEIQIEIIEKTKQIEVQEQETKRREQELDATVRKPAEAEQFRIQKIADAQRYQIEAEAEGRAAAERAQGKAQAEVIQAKGFSEAEAMQKKATAWQNYSQAAIIEQVVAALPEIVTAIAQPLSKLDKIVVISNDGANGAGSGAAKITADVGTIVAQLPALVEALTGMSIQDTLKNLPGNLTKPDKPAAEVAKTDEG